MTNPFEHARRGRLTGQDYAKVFARCGGRCMHCGKMTRGGEVWEADHIISLENGGTDEADNLQVLCRPCHSLKTRDDHAKAGHARRAYTKHFVNREHTRS